MLVHPAASELNTQPVQETPFFITRSPCPARAQSLFYVTRFPSPTIAPVEVSVSLPLCCLFLFTIVLIYTPTLLHVADAPRISSRTFVLLFFFSTERSRFSWLSCPQTKMISLPRESISFASRSLLLVYLFVTRLFFVSLHVACDVCVSPFVLYVIG